MPYIASKDIKHTDREITQKPRRILHVLGGMNRGGIETWLMQILQHIDRDRFQMDFLVHSTKPALMTNKHALSTVKLLPVPIPLDLGFTFPIFGGFCVNTNRTILFIVTFISSVVIFCV